MRSPACLPAACSPGARSLTHTGGEDKTYNGETSVKVSTVSYIRRFHFPERRRALAHSSNIYREPSSPLFNSLLGHLSRKISRRRPRTHTHLIKNRPIATLGKMRNVCDLLCVAPFESEFSTLGKSGLTGFVLIPAFLNLFGQNLFSSSEAS
jgi:hypothetical protein